MNRRHIRILTTLVKSVVSMALIYYCFTLIDSTAIIGILSRINFELLIYAIGINFIGTILLKSILIWRLITAQPPISLLQVVMINLGLRFYTLFLPRAVATGIRWHKYKKISNSRSSLVLLTFESILSVTFLSAGSYIWLFISEQRIENPSVIVALTATTIFFTLILACFFSRNILEFYSKIATCLLPTQWLKDQIDKLKEATIEFRFFTIRAITESFLISCFSYILFLSSAYIVALSINISLDFSVIALIRSLVLLLALLPITVAGLGIRELGFITLLGQYGVDSDLALSYAMTSFLVQIIIGLSGGIIEGNNWIRKTSD